MCWNRVRRTRCFTRETTRKHGGCLGVENGLNLSSLFQPTAPAYWDEWCKTLSRFEQHYFFHFFKLRSSLVRVLLDLHQKSFSLQSMARNQKDLNQSTVSVQRMRGCGLLIPSWATPITPLPPRLREVWETGTKVVRVSGGNNIKKTVFTRQNKAVGKTDSACLWYYIGDLHSLKISITGVGYKISA